MTVFAYVGHDKKSSYSNIYNEKQVIKNVSSAKDNTNLVAVTSTCRIRTLSVVTKYVVVIK